MRTLFFSLVALALLIVSCGKRPASSDQPARAAALQNLPAAKMPYMGEEELAKLVNTNMSKLEITNRFGPPDIVMTTDNGLLAWHFLFEPISDQGPRRTTVSGLSTYWREDRMVRWSPSFGTTGGKAPSEFLKPIEPSSEAVVTDPANRSVSFWLVSGERIEGGRYIDTAGLPKLGWIARESNLTVTQLAAVEAGHEPVNYDGKGPREEYQFNVTLMPGDAEAFKRITQQSIGRQVLIMVGDRPAAAPRIISPIPSGRFVLIVDEKKEFEEIRTMLGVMIGKE